MTKNQLQQELKKEVKPGIKPSDLKKKLKRSKSDSDIPKVPALPNNSDPPTPLLQEQLKEKQTEIESLREQLETTNQKLTENTAELDNSLEARQQSLKDWTKLFDQVKSLRIELEENVEQASTELIDQDKVMVDLRSKVVKLKLEKQSLVRDLELASRLAESRKYPLPDNSNSNYLKYALYSLCAVGFTLWLNNNLKIYDKSPRTITNLNQFKK